MKRSITLFISVLLTLNVFSQGVNFRDIPFEQALTEAKKENKFLFVDCYTSWCGPCKFMADSIFIQKEVGDFFNKTFVAVKYDMEKTPSFSEKYYIAAYPTFFLFSPEGDVISTFKGASKTAKEWLPRIDEALTNGKNLDKARVAYRQNIKSAKNTQKYLDELIKTKYQDGIYELLLEQFAQSDSKIDFLYENKDVVAKNLTLTTFERFMKKLKTSSGYIPDMADIFKGLVF